MNYGGTKTRYELENSCLRASVVFIVHDAHEDSELHLHFESFRVLRGFRDFDAPADFLSRRTRISRRPQGC